MRFAMCVFATLIFNRSVHAQLQISEVVYQMDGWQITTLTENSSVDSLLLTRLGEAPNPTLNINAVLATRTPSGWVADAWVGEEVASVLVWMHEELGLPDPRLPDRPWTIDGIEDSLDTATKAGDPVPFGKGVTASHPLADAITMLQDPNYVLNAMESIGEPAAASSVTAGGNIGSGTSSEPSGPPSSVCPLRSAEDLWDAIAASIEAYNVDPALLNETFDNSIDPLPSGQPRACCRPRRTYTAPVFGPWVCGPWTVREVTVRVPSRVTVKYHRVANRFETRTCTRVGILCGVTVTPQSRTMSGRQCFLYTYNRINQDGLAFPVPPTPPPGATGLPGCTGPDCVPATGNWTPGC